MQSADAIMDELDQQMRDIRDVTQTLSAPIGGEEELDLDMEIGLFETTPLLEPTKPIRGRNNKLDQIVEEEPTRLLPPPRIDAMMEA